MNTEVIIAINSDKNAFFLIKLVESVRKHKDIKQLRDIVITEKRKKHLVL